MPDNDVERVARERIASAQNQIMRSLARVREGVPLAAEWDSQRLRNRLQAKAALSREEAEAITLGIQAVGEATPEQRREYFKERGPEAIYGKTIDFVGVAFLERGGVAAHAVGRVAYTDGRPLGSGFLVSDRLFITNNHVISSSQTARNLCIEFDYELDPAAQPRGPTRFALDPSVFFVTDPVAGLDYTLIAVGQKLSGPKRLNDYGWCALSNASDKHALGEVANIVQHPDGRYKEVVLRENRLVARLDLVLHYIADTEPGSSGSPVFNNEWEVIALHHWGGPWRQQVDETGRPLDQEVNEGIRISAIVNDLRAKGATLTGEARSLLQRVFQLGESRIPAPRAPIADAEPSTNFRVDPDGSVSWQIPIELSVRLPALAGTNRHATEPLSASPQPFAEPLAEAKLRPNQNYDNRSGYKPRFIEGHTIELPGLPPALARDAARNRQRQPGDDPHELRYHHFSIVINAARRLAFFTACNIDGANAKHVDRDTGDVTSLQANDDRLESIWASSEAAEASETWYDDPRLDPREYAGRDIYQGQVVPGFPDPRSMGRTLRMFQRGHLVRRMDPAWGSDAMARQSDADTFHWTNCSPQVGFFNMGRAKKSWYRRREAVARDRELRAPQCGC